MKTSTKTKYSLLAIMFVGTMLSSCKKDKDDPHDDEDHTAPIVLNINPKAGTQTFAFSTNYTDDFGTVYQFTRAEFYVSNMILKDDVGNTVFTPGKYYIIRPTTASYALGTTDAHHFHEMELVIGVDSLTNISDPTTYTNDLAPQVPSMHWSWSSGYIFVALEGVADRTGDGIPEAAFQFHIGTHSLRKLLELHVHQDIVHGTTNNLNLTIDYKKFFTGIDLSDPNSHTHTMDNMTLATQVFNNIDSVFTFE